MSFVLIAIVVLPMASALVAVLLSERRATTAGRVSTTVMGVVVTAVAVIAVTVARGGQVSAMLAGTNGGCWPGCTLIGSVSSCCY